MSKSYEHKKIKINNIEIDKKLKNIITNFWSQNGLSFHCCQGGLLDPEEFSKEDIIDDPDVYYLNDKEEICEKAWIIIHYKDLINLINILKKFDINDFYVELGARGYEIFSEEDLCFVAFKIELLNI